MHRIDGQGREHARHGRLIARREALVSSVVMLSAAACRRRVTRPLTIAVSASLGDFVRATLRNSAHPTVRDAVVIEGAAATLVRQIVAGAPYDAIVAADEAPLRAPSAAGAFATEPVEFAEGAAVLLFSPSYRGERSLAALARTPGTRVAIANPETAPFGRAAREVLARAGLATALERATIVAENVRAALALADRSEVDAAFTARSLVVTSPYRGRWIAVERSYHRPVSHMVAVTKSAEGSRRLGADALVRALVAMSDATLAEHGLDPPRQRR